MDRASESEDGDGQADKVFLDFPSVVQWTRMIDATEGTPLVSTMNSM